MALDRSELIAFYILYSVYSVGKRERERKEQIHNHLQVDTDPVGHAHVSGHLISIGMN